MSNSIFADKNVAYEEMGKNERYRYYKFRDAARSRSGQRLQLHAIQHCVSSPSCRSTASWFDGQSVGQSSRGMLDSDMSFDRITNVRDLYQLSSEITELKPTGI